MTTKQRASKVVCAFFTCLAMIMTYYVGHADPVAAVAAQDRASSLLPQLDPTYPPCADTTEYEYVYEKQWVWAWFPDGNEEVSQLTPDQVKVAADKPPPPPPPPPGKKGNWRQILVDILIQIIIWIIEKCFGASAAAITALAPPAKLLVTFVVNNGSKVSKELSPSGQSSGRTAYRLNVASLSLKPGDTIELTSIQFLDGKGAPTGPVVGSGPVKLVVPGRLLTSATSQSRSSKYRTWVTDKSADTGTTSNSCAGPYEYRIQKRKTTKYRSRGKVKVRVTWRNLSKRYSTNKHVGNWHYRTVDLKKGTYRSVINGKCGLIGGYTTSVTLKR